MLRTSVSTTLQLLIAPLRSLRAIDEPEILRSSSHQFCLTSAGSGTVIELLRSAYARVLAEPGFAWKEYRAGVYRGLGGATVAGVASWQAISFVANNAQALKIFAEQAFHNPTLVQIIDAISKLGGGQ